MKTQILLLRLEHVGIKMQRHGGQPLTWKLVLNLEAEIINFQPYLLSSFYRAANRLIHAYHFL